MVLHEGIVAVVLVWLTFFIAFVSTVLLGFVGPSTVLADEIPVYRVVLEHKDGIEMLNPAEDLSRDECFAKVRELRHKHGPHARCIVAMGHRQVT